MGLLSSCKKDRNTLRPEIRNFALRAAALALCVFAAACSRNNPQSTAPAQPAAEQAAVVVYAAYDDKTYLPSLFNEFTQKTGTVVIVRNGEVPGIIQDVIQKRSTPPADVLITPSVAGVWHVAEESELRPNYSAVVEGVPNWLKDPEKYWVALGYQTAVIVFDPDQVDTDKLGAYEDLSDESLRRKLCLSSSGLAINRSVIAMLIEKLGKRDAEIVVRGWVANMARPAFDSETQLLRAIENGDCGVGIVASSSVAGTRLGVHTPSATYFDIEAIGIARHARNPDGAAALIDWLLSPPVQTRHAAQTGRLPVVGADQALDEIVLIAAGLEEAKKLAERARYR
jgi:iron(III) transport system substrate-binding protein